MIQLPRSKPTVGRPRANPKRRRLPPEQDIVVAAARLFGRKGFKGTTTREIAQAVGLQQPSLFHYFDDKLAILDAVVRQMLEPLLAFIEELDRAPLRAVEKLARLIRFDVQQLCSSRIDQAAIARLPELQERRFAYAREQERRVHAAYLGWIEEATQDGDIATSDAELSAIAVTGMVEATTAAGRSRDEASAIADHIVQLALRALQDPHS